MFREGRICQAYGVELCAWEKYDNTIYFTVNDFVCDFGIDFKTFAEAKKRFIETVNGNLTNDYRYKKAKSVITKKQMFFYDETIRF